MVGVFGYVYWSRLIKATLVGVVNKETDGLYQLKIGTLYYGLLQGNIYIRNLSLIPDTAVYNILNGDSAPSLLLSLHVDQLTVKNLQLRKAIFHKRIEVDQIEVSAPDLKLWRKRISIKDTTGNEPDTAQSIPLPGGWDYLSAGKISLRNGNFTFTDQTWDSVKEYTIPSVDITISNLWVDSTWRTDPRIYNTDDIAVILREIRQETGNGMYAIHIGEMGFSTGRRLIYINRFHLEPMYDRTAFSRKLGYQTDRMDICIATITLSAVDWRELLLRRRVIAEKLLIDSLVLDDYRDKRVPMRPGFKPLMPQQLLRDLKTYIRIDSLELVNGKATYSEQVANEPGTLFFDRMSGILTGLTNDSAWLADKQISPLKAKAYLQGTGKLQATINFIFGDPMNRFSIPYATLTSFELPQVNTMLSKLLPAEIESGFVSKLVIHGIRFNNSFSRGSLTLYYDNLSFKMFDEKNTTWSGIKTGLINWVAKDILVAKCNPGPNGKLNSGTVYFQRDQHKSIINFIWKSVLSGLKSNMGFNTKEQKEIKKGKNSRRVKKQ